jgi:hypothetical protein
MDANGILVIGGVVGTLSKFLMMGGDIKGRWITVIAFLVSTLSVWVWGYSHGDFARETTWDYFAGWAATLAVAAGAFHGTEEAVKKVTGTGDGR